MLLSYRNDGETSSKCYEGLRSDALDAVMLPFRHPKNDTLQVYFLCNLFSTTFVIWEVYAEQFRKEANKRGLCPP
jgi:hypothetical protein